MITQERLKELLHYDPESGIFTRLKNQTNSTKVGERAGTMQHGYRHIKIDKVKYKASHLAWLYIYGKWPDHIIDHINNTPDDDRISNLQDITLRGNQQRRTKLRKDNTSGYIGVCYNKGAKKFAAQILINGHSKHLGLFNTAEEASIAYQQAKLQLHFNH